MDNRHSRSDRADIRTLTERIRDLENQRRALEAELAEGEEQERRERIGIRSPNRYHRSSTRDEMRAPVELQFQRRPSLPVTYVDRHPRDYSSFDERSPRRHRSGMAQHLSLEPRRPHSTPVYQGQRRPSDHTSEHRRNRDFERIEDFPRRLSSDGRGRRSVTSVVVEEVLRASSQRRERHYCNGHQGRSSERVYHIIERSPRDYC